MSLMDKVKKNSTIKESSVLKNSKFFKEKDVITTPIPALNIALSGRVDGGFTPSITVFSGISRNFKTGFSLLMAKSYLDKYPDAILMFFDNEFGANFAFFETFGIDTSRVFHVPVLNIEQLTFDLVQQLENLDRGDKVIIIIDSTGNIASKKELENANEGKSTEDMTRSKKMKSLWRMITPMLTMKDIPLVAVAHTYKEQTSMYPRDIVSGGCVIEGTKLTMEDGSLKNIEDIKEGEFVKTLSGSDRVSYVWNPDTLDNGEKECYEVTFEDGYSVVCSENHKFLINDEWVEAKDILIGNDVKCC